MLNEKGLDPPEFEFNRGAFGPVQCLSDACVMLKGNYGSLLGVMIIAFVLILIASCLPFMPIVPPIVCGIYLCMFAAMERQPFSTGTLFKGFEYFWQSFLAFLVLSVPLGILSGISQIGLTALENAENPNATPEEDLQSFLFDFGFVFGMIFVIYAASLIIGTLTAFVYPLIVDRKMKAGSALKLSFRAVMGNFFGVAGLMILGQLLMIAGLWLFFIGGLLVAPVVFGAWAIAYRRVFPLRTSHPTATPGALPENQKDQWAPPVSGSKAGWLLTFASIMIFVVTGIGIAVGFGYLYQRVLTRIHEEKIENQKPETEEIDSPIQNEPSPDPGEELESVSASPAGQEQSDKTSTGKTISGGVINGKAVKLPKPDYPPAARAVNARGSVSVQVVVDEKGDVISASAVSGHPLLRAPAAAAAQKAKFKPTILSGEAVKLSGILIYDFSP